MMKTLSDTVEVRSFGTVYPKKSKNDRIPYDHQKKAMESLDILDQEDSYSTLVVIPTGGGKTYTASAWLLKNAIDRKKKILWIAHRKLLLDQAAESFQRFAYTEIMPHVSSFSFRIVSGAAEHGRTGDISGRDNLLIASKDSIGRNLERLDPWLKGEQELYMVIDEAHHSPAKTYRRVIDYVKARVPGLKLIGLTATPFRTAEEEQGLLARIYRDGVKDRRPVRDDIGIAYQISLKELISRRILSRPVFESFYTDEDYGEHLGVDAWNSIQHFDKLPEDVEREMADSAVRNRLIVDTYLAGREKYGQTILFAVNITHAIHLAALFNKSGISADYIVSSVRDEATGVTLSQRDNQVKWEAYRTGKLKVLINVNILTEGADLPQTQTVFLTRPTVSSILMTQMVGRALRGTAAGGTDSAYIVSFIDHWNEHIAWVNPETLFDGNNEFSEGRSERTRQLMNLIAISKIEEFAAMLDDSIDTTALERVPFEERIPVGMYAFSYLEQNGMDPSYQVMVYNSTQEAYRQLMEELPALFESFSATEPYLEDAVLEEMEEQCRRTFFCGEMIPAYGKQDVIRVLKYYALYGEAPKFYTFDEVDHSRLDVTKIAEHIWNSRMSRREEAEYINGLWNNTDENLLRLFFGRKLYFQRQLDTEIMKLQDPSMFEEEDHVVCGRRELSDLPLHEIGKIAPETEKQLRDRAFAEAMDQEGCYHCAGCGFTSRSRVPFQVDHIVPMNRGGKSVPENLQILCRSCNGKKGDRE